MLKNEREISTAMGSLLQNDLPRKMSKNREKVEKMSKNREKVENDQKIARSRDKSLTKQFHR